ncbi:F-box/LRR-repeat protein 10-like [Papaver somniferum]|uniref:F-box/LRR-repeat protein 10-like n=1 Tax=Papaver somniferum TaxID=3469 RepID=UPI000E6F6AA2|nr:F-box/LRR-repeat protein 10-like [Papaver somniferum]
MEMTKSTAPEGQTLEYLPSVLLASIMTKLDVSSICSVASTCKTFNACASQILSFLPNFHLIDIAPPMKQLTPLLPTNPYLKSIRVDCKRLDDKAIDCLLKPSLEELYLYNCEDFSGKLLSRIGFQCSNLKSLYLGLVAEKRGRSIWVSDLEELLCGCSELESLSLMFDISMFLPDHSALAWTLASPNLVNLEIGEISSILMSEILSPTAERQQQLLPSEMRTPMLPNIQKLCITVDYVTDTLVGTISECLLNLTHLDLQDTPVIEPNSSFDLSNSGLQRINQHGRLKHLSLVRSQQYLRTYFRRVNDLGILYMADKCSNMESISLGGFCRVTDSGFRAILHSCANLQKLRVSRGTQLTDLVFHDISATSLSLTNVSLRWCNLLTDHAVVCLAYNMDLNVLDLRECRHLGDESLKAISVLLKLKTLLLDGSDITDTGLSYLGEGVLSSLTSLSVRGCRKLTYKCISSIFEGSSVRSLQNLDLSYLPNFSDNGILLLAKTRARIIELRMRGCPLIGDSSVMALASMQVEDGWWHGSSLRLMDLYECRGITQLSFRWLKKPYFPRLRWFGVTGSINAVMVEALKRSRPLLHIACRGEELGICHWDSSEGLYRHDREEVDELEQWLLEGENGTDYGTDFENDDGEGGMNEDYEGEGGPEIAVEINNGDDEMVELL